MGNLADTPSSMQTMVSPDTSLENEPFNRLAQIAGLASQDRPLEARLPDLAQATAEALGFDSGWVTLLAPCGDRAQAHYLFNLPAAEGRDYPLEDSPDAQIVAADEPLRLVLEDLDRHPALEGLATQVLYGAALRTSGQIYGTLKLLGRQPRVLSQPETRLLEAAALQIASAVRAHCLEVEVHRLTITDSLTGLYNQSYFLELAAQELKRAKRYEHPFSLLMMDIDHFREINENYGYLVGDEVLQAVSQTCHESLRQVDILARFGGEEFVLLLPETGLTEALGVAGRLLYTLRATPAQTTAGNIPVTISIGVSGLGGANGLTLDKLLDQADKALYQSKKNGRNRVTVWVED
jgi:diguanylate cyclase (GGDEF)-like protein